MKNKNDSEDLEKLFDEVATQYNEASPITDSPDLEQLFDQVSSETSQNAQLATESEHVDCDCNTEKVVQERVFNRIGSMARSLHDTLGELGSQKHKLIQHVVTALPDAKDRLDYVANLTEQAACKVLNATDIAVPIVEDLGLTSKDFGKRWDKAFNNELTTEEFKKLAEETKEFFNSEMPKKITLTREQLIEIMMAQDFQDLTGQVIKKIFTLAQELESGLMSVLLEVVPDKKKTDEVANLMNGPVVNPEGRNDVVVNQAQVDDLLDSLGF